jgi:hypothetical protein
VTALSVPKAREMLYDRSAAVCEVCGRARGTNAQHRKNRSQGGTWELSNLIHVCGSGTTGCHGYIHAHPTESYACGWSVRQANTPREMPALLTGPYGPRYMWLHDDGTTAFAYIAAPFGTAERKSG